MKECGEKSCTWGDEFKVSLFTILKPLALREHVDEGMIDGIRKFSGTE